MMEGRERNQENSQRNMERRRAKELQIMADRVCCLILNDDFPDIDIEIARSELRERCRELFPEKMYLYDMIYESRFKRLKEQFRDRDE